MEKLLKEKDKLEMQALAARIHERDEAKKNQKKTQSNVIEAQNNELNKMSMDEINQMVPELRKKAREKYLRDREGQ